MAVDIGTFNMESRYFNPLTKKPAEIHSLEFLLVFIYLLSCFYTKQI